MKQNNFSMNIDEAVLWPIAAFVYCNHRQQPAVGGRQKAEISARQQAPAQQNSTHGRSFAKIIL